MAGYSSELTGKISVECITSRSGGLIAIVPKLGTLLTGQRFSAKGTKDCWNLKLNFSIKVICSFNKYLLQISWGTWDKDMRPDP